MDSCANANPRRVLLAGCGDLGRRVARLLRARGDEVWALRRTAMSGGDGVHWLQGDLGRPDTLRDLPTAITHVVYLPAPAARDEAAYRVVFPKGLQHLLQALQGASLQRVLLVSSSAVYGGSDGAWVDEHTLPDPPAFNGAALLATEQWLAAQPLSSVVLRLAGLYGPGRTALMDRLRAGLVRVPRDEPHWANRIHVDDAAAAIVHLLQLPTPQPLYLGVDDAPLPLYELYDHVARLIGAPLPLQGLPPSGVGSKRLSNARLKASGFTLQWPDAREGYAALLA